MQPRDSQLIVGDKLLATNNEIDMLIQYSLTKDIPEKYLAPNYIELFDIEYNENFYQY